MQLVSGIPFHGYLELGKLVGNNLLSTLIIYVVLVILISSTSFVTSTDLTILYSLRSFCLKLLVTIGDYLL